MVHRIKFKGKNLCDAVYSGEKTFEIRKNDRNYKVGDIVCPIPVDDNEELMAHPLSNKRYLITYVSVKWQDILANGYCVFSMREYTAKII